MRAQLVIEHNTGVRARCLSASAAVPAAIIRANGLRISFPKQSHCQRRSEFWAFHRLSKYFPDAIVERNAFIARWGNYPANNLFPRRWKRSLHRCGVRKLPLNPSSSLKAAEAMKGCRGSLRVEYGSFRRWKFEFRRRGFADALPWRRLPGVKRSRGSGHSRRICCGYPDTGVRPALTSALSDACQTGQVLSDDNSLRSTTCYLGSHVRRCRPCDRTEHGPCLANPHAASIS